MPINRWLVTALAIATLSPAVAHAQSPCASLSTLAIAADHIGLPSSGAHVAAAQTVGASCHVTAEIAPLDPAAPPIKLEVNLPETWNGKALMYGGGGFNGSILSSPGAIRLQPAGMPTPLGRGFATFASNSGHAGPSTDGSFAANDEALRNYAHEALKKTHDVAVQVIAQRYGRKPDKLYFRGSSNGGKEALAMIQKYPSDLDGAIIFWPAPLYTRLALQFAKVSRALLQPGAYPDLAQRRAVLDAAFAACDGFDGAADHLISNNRQCQRSFDPATAHLSPPQLAAFQAMESPIDLAETVGTGVSYPGFNAWGTDFGSRTDDDMSRGVTAQGLGTVAPAFPVTAGMPFMHNFADQFLKYFVTRDPNADWRNLDPEHPGKWRARLADLANLLDMTQTDLSAFARRGGKIVMVHGMADQIIPPQATEQYFDAVVRTMGRDTVAGFFKFYELPGTAHSGNGTAFTPTWDALGALDHWVTAGGPPENPVVTDTYAVAGRTRPLCEYPGWPHYKGTGDVNQAANFDCAE